MMWKEVAYFNLRLRSSLFVGDAGEKLGKP